MSFFFTLLTAARSFSVRGVCVSLHAAYSEAAMIAEVEAAAKVGDSLGGIVEVLGYGVPPGLGSHVHWDRKVDGLLAQALMSIQAMKGVEIGDGFEVAALRGSDAHDEILWDDDAGEYTRGSTRAGGTEGGMTTGGLLVARVAMKPLATLNRPVLKTVDTTTKEETVSFKERTDVTAVPASGVVAETLTALNETDAALNLWKQVTENHAYPRAKVQLAELYLARNQPDLALPELREVLAEDVHAPAFQRKRDRVWVRRARGLMRKLG